MRLTKENLLAERDSLRNELNLVEKLLDEKFNWKASNGKTTSENKTITEAITDWCESLVEGTEITITDVMNHVVQIRKNEIIHPSSVSSIFAKIKGEYFKTIYPGSGRRSGKYRKL